MWSMWSATSAAVTVGGTCARSHTSSSRVTVSRSLGYASRSRWDSAHHARFCSAPAFVTNHGTKVAITTPPLRPTSSSTSSGTLRGTSASARAPEWEKNDRRLAHVDRLAHHVVRHMAAIHQHTQTVQLPDDLLTDPREAAVRVIAGRAVGPGQIVVMRERHIGGTEPGEHP